MPTTAMRLTIRAVPFATLLMASSLATSSMDAQPTRRVNVHPDTLARVIAGLSPATTAATNAYVNGPDSSARNALGALRADPAALRFVLTVLTKEPSRDMRRSLVGIIQASENRAGPMCGRHSKSWCGRTPTPSCSEARSRRSV